MLKSTRRKSLVETSQLTYKEDRSSSVSKNVRSSSKKLVTTETIKETKSSQLIKRKLKKKKKLELVITKETLRPRKGMKFIWKTGQGLDSDFEYDDSPIEEKKPRKKLKRAFGEQRKTKREFTFEDFEDVYEDESVAKKQHIEEVLDKIPKNKKQLSKLYDKVEERLIFYKQLFISEQLELAKKKSHIPDDAIPICSDVRTFDFKKLADVQKKFGGRLFDVIMMDPPWQLSTSQPSRGVAIAYESLSDEVIQKMPIASLQDNGFIFLWTINAKYAVAAKLIEHWGYRLVDEVTWIKKTINGKIAKGHGFYLQHAKESCLIGVKGKVNSKVKKASESDIIFSQRRGQSQKPEEIYTLIENLVPNGFYLEIFGRRNNLRSKWTTIGNEL